MKTVFLVFWIAMQQAPIDCPLCDPITVGFCKEPHYEMIRDTMVAAFFDEGSALWYENQMIQTGEVEKSWIETYQPKGKE